MIINGNAFDIPLKDKSVHCVVTSPPYYSLRKYAGEQEYTFSDGWTGAYGLEPTLQMYIDHTVEWAREVHRVLRDDGTFWLNIGDSYFGSNTTGRNDVERKYPGSIGRGLEATKTTREAEGLKPKDLMGVPWRVALALQADGWYLRSDIIWHKPNPMPESVTDRPTKAHEYLFLLTKSRKYYYDADAIREGAKPDDSIRDRDNTKLNNTPGRSRMGGLVTNQYPTRNKRTVWTIATAPYSGAHFATYPPALVEPCIKAGTSEHGVCPECGNGWERVVEKPNPPKEVFTKTRKPQDGLVGGFNHDGEWVGGGQKLQNWLNANPTKTTGWQPTCEHELDPIPATVFDPFSGSGTTMLVARNLGRKGIGLDLSADYIDLAKARLGLKALDEWTQGKSGDGLAIEELPLFAPDSR